MPSPRVSPSPGMDSRLSSRLSSYLGPFGSSSRWTTLSALRRSWSSTAFGCMLQRLQTFACLPALCAEPSWPSEAEAAIALLLSHVVLFSAESADTVVRGADCDVASDPAAAHRKFVQTISWNAGTLATDSIHSQRDSGCGTVIKPCATTISSAAATAVATGPEERSRPLKKRRTWVEPAQPPGSGVQS